MPIPQNFIQPKRLTAKEKAFEQILQWIIDGTLQPAEKLNDNDLANALGVSRTPIRESLQLLASQGFVEMFPGKATQVTEVDLDSIQDLLPPLAAMQALSAQFAIPNVTDHILQQLETINEQFARAIRTNDTFLALKKDGEFHELIGEVANNQYIASIVSNLHAHVQRLFFHNAIVMTAASIEEHQQIIQCMRDGDQEKVASIMQHNWLRAIDEFYNKKMDS